MNCQARCRLHLSFSVLLGLGAIGCDDAAEATADAGGAGDTGAAKEQTRTIGLTLVTILAADASDPIAEPHTVHILDSVGEELDPPITVMSEAKTGRVQVDVPRDAVVGIHVEGSGTELSDTYDVVALNDDLDNGEELLRVSNVGLAATAGNVAGYDAMPDRAALGGAIYVRPTGQPRIGTVGCAQVFIDDDTTGLDDSISQRYNGSGGLPAAKDAQTETTRSGRFLLGNIGPGAHTARVSLDGGETFIGEPTSFFVHRTRAQALGPFKSILYTLGVDLDLSENPTPADCPAG